MQSWSSLIRKTAPPVWLEKERNRSSLPISLALPSLLVRGHVVYAVCQRGGRAWESVEKG